MIYILMKKWKMKKLHSRTSWWGMLSTHCHLKIILIIWYFCYKENACNNGNNSNTKFPVFAPDDHLWITHTHPHHESQNSKNAVELIGTFGLGWSCWRGYFFLIIEAKIMAAAKGWVLLEQQAIHDISNKDNDNVLTWKRFEQCCWLALCLCPWILTRYWSDWSTATECSCMKRQGTLSWTLRATKVPTSCDELERMGGCRKIIGDLNWYCRYISSIFVPITWKMVNWFVWIKFIRNVK